MSVQCGNYNIAALIDCGSSINIVSLDLFNSLPDKLKSSIIPFNDTIKLANAIQINVIGTAEITIKTDKFHTIKVYLLPKTSHPMILGIRYLRTHGINVSFKNIPSGKSYKIRSDRKLCIERNSELIIWGQLPNNLSIGMQGVCVNSGILLRSKGVLLAKTLVGISINHTVPLRVLNPTNKCIYIPKGAVLSDFHPIDTGYDIIVNADQNLCSRRVESISHADIDNKNKSFRSKFEDEFILPDTLNSYQKQKLSDCLFQNNDIFVTKENSNLGYTTVVQHKIILKSDAKPKHQRPYRLPPHKKEVLRHHLDELLQQGIIAPVSENEDVPITSPIVLVTKRAKPTSAMSDKDAALSQYRFVCDFRYLNSQTKEFKYHIPNLDELTESFSHTTPNFITSIDLSSGFFQMSISSDSTKYTAFNTCFGTYKFLRLPMGLSTAPASFQLLMDKVLRGLTFKSCLCYLDDVLICSDTFEQHIKDLNDVFGRFRSAGLKLGPRKCSFAQESCVFLGHLISKDGIRPPPDRVKAIQEYPQPTNIKELRRLLGLFNWFRKYIPNYSVKISPLTKLLKKGQNFQWRAEQSVAFDNLKQSLLNSQVLAFPKFDLPFRLAVDTSSRGIGYMLYQIHNDNGKETPRVVRFGSKSLSKWQQSYGPTKLELLGMVVSILDCSDYLRGNRFVVECDHQALKPIFQKQFKGAIYERWLAILQQYNFDLQYKPAEQMQVADALSRNHWEISGDQCDKVVSPDEDDPFFPYVTEETGDIKLPNGQNLADLLRNNSDIDGINKCSFVNIQDPEYDADTDDVIEHSGFNRKKHKKRATNVINAIDITSDSAFDKTTDVQAHQNQFLDESTESNRNTKSNYDKTTDIDRGKSDNVDINLSEIGLFENCDFTYDNIKDLQRQDSDLKPIIQYLENKTLPISQKQSRKLLLEAADYILVKGVLFHSNLSKSKIRKSTHNHHYKLVVPKLMINVVLQMCHDSPMGGHAGIQNTVDRVREFYYFHRLPTIVAEYVRSCHECQIRKTSSFHTKAGLVSFPIPSEPFQVWEMDLCGPFPLSSAGHTYIFTAIDMFSKFIYAEPLLNCDSLTVGNAIYRLFTTFGVCKTIVTDQGSEFIARSTRELCKQMHVSQEFTPSFTHHCLGACERSHRTLEERMTPYIRQGKSWHDILPAIVFSINSCVSSSTHYSPFEVVYGRRPQYPLVNPTDVDFRDLPKDAHVYLKQLCKKLQIVRDEVKSNIEKSNIEMLKRANEKISPLTVKVGDFVYLHEDNACQGRKLQANFSGPYIVNKIQSPHLIKLRDPNKKKDFTCQCILIDLKWLILGCQNQPHIYNR